MDEQTDYIEQQWELISPAQIDGRFDGRTDEAIIRKWALVLNARYIVCRVEHDETGWQLLVSSDQLPRATDELQAFEAENRNWPPIAPPYRSARESRLSTLSLLLLLATFHNITRLTIPIFGYPAPDWMEIGSAKVHLIHYGEWWRLITALTLHADSVHLLSNLTIGGFFVYFLCRELGSGLAWTLLFFAGTLGNWANSLVQLPTHSSVGSSTAVFGAVGILAVINFVRHTQGLG
ncbi:MAG: rhomboid family intramembrane serine protease, partial [Geobacteraceae bacterium]|nr:rhomboid family intramembrane serine protease [Geobacteraceae bacterium]